MRFLTALFFLALSNSLLAKDVNPPSLAEITSGLESAFNALGSFRVVIRTDIRERDTHKAEFSNTFRYAHAAGTAQIVSTLGGTKRDLF